MKRVSVSELKARLSAFLDIARLGEDVLVTDRGRPVARLAPVRGQDHKESRRDLLIRTGRLIPPANPLPDDFLERPRPTDRPGYSLAALLEEREGGGRR